MYVNEMRKIYTLSKVLTDNIKRKKYINQVANSTKIKVRNNGYRS